MKTRTSYISYLLTFIALVTFTQAFATLKQKDTGEISPQQSIRIPITRLQSSNNENPVESILAGAYFDFSFTATIRDSLKRARAAAVERAIQHFQSSALRITDRLLAAEVLYMMSHDFHQVDPHIVRKRIAPWERYIEKYAHEYGIDPNFIRAIIYAESGGNPVVVSYMGAMGLMQLMPDTADFLGISDPFNPEQNIMGGIQYITWLAEYFSDFNEVNLLWAWHAGPAMHEKLLLPETTRDFILKVLDVKRRLDMSLSGEPV